MLLLYFAIVLYGPNTQQHSAAKDVHTTRFISRLRCFPKPHDSLVVVHTTNNEHEAAAVSASEAVGISVKSCACLFDDSTMNICRRVESRESNWRKLHNIPPPLGPYKYILILYKLFPSKQPLEFTEASLPPPKSHPPCSIFRKILLEK